MIARPGRSVVPGTTVLFTTTTWYHWPWRGRDRSVGRRYAPNMERSILPSLKGVPTAISESSLPVTAVDQVGSRM